MRVRLEIKLAPADDRGGVLVRQAVEVLARRPVELAGDERARAVGADEMVVLAAAAVEAGLGADVEDVTKDG